MTGIRERPSLDGFEWNLDRLLAGIGTFDKSFGALLLAFAQLDTHAFGTADF